MQYQTPESSYGSPKESSTRTNTEENNYSVPSTYIS